MRMSAIKSICTKAKQFILYEGNGSQWIGTEECCFRVDDTFRLSEDAIPDIFDLSEKKLEKISITTRPLEESDLMPMGECDESAMMSEWSAVMQEHGNQYKFLESKEHRLFIIDYNAIFGGTESGVYRRFYLLHNPQGDAVIALSDGMILTGLIKPIDGKTQEMIQKGMRNLGFMMPGMKPKEEEEPEEEEPLEEQMMLEELSGPEEEEHDPTPYP